MFGWFLSSLVLCLIDLVDLKINFFKKYGRSNSHIMKYQPGVGRYLFMHDRVQQLAYVTYVGIPTFISIHMIVDMHTLIHTRVKIFWFL